MHCAREAHGSTGDRTASGRWRRGAFAALAGVVLAGCGGGDEGPKAAPAVAGGNAAGAAGQKQAGQAQDAATAPGPTAPGPGGGSQPGPGTRPDPSTPAPSALDPSTPAPSAPLGAQAPGPGAPAPPPSASPAASCGCSGIATLFVAPQADAWVSSAPGHKNHGTDEALRVGGPGDARTLVRFESACIAATLDGWELVSARLELTIGDVGNGWGNAREDARTIDLHRVTTAWTEAGATWDSPTDPGQHPGTTWDMAGAPPYAATPSGSVVLGEAPSGVLAYDVTADVQAFLAGGANQGWLLRRRNEQHGSARLDLGAREGPSAPRLVLTVRDVVVPVVDVVSPLAGTWNGPTAPARATFQDAHSGVRPGSALVVANGHDVTASVTHTATEAQATLAAISTALAQGPGNTVTVSVRDCANNVGSGSVTFNYDSIGPTVALEPADTATVTTDVVTLRATYGDAGAGVDTGSFSATLDGQPIAFAVGPTEATVTSPVLSEGPHTLTVILRDQLGNQTVATSTFTVVLRGDLLGVVAGGTDAHLLSPLAGVRVVALNAERNTTVTDAQGQFRLQGVRWGPVVVVADGYAQGHGRVSIRTTITAGEQVFAPRMWLLQPLGQPTPFTLDGGGRTTSEVVVTDPAVPGARFRIAPGSRVVLPDDGFAYPAGTPPSFSIQRVPQALACNPLPALPDATQAWYAPYGYTLQPEGAEVVEGYEVALPNDQAFAAGSHVPLFLYDSRVGDYVLKGQALVSADGQTLSLSVNTVIGKYDPVKLGTQLAINGSLSFDVPPPAPGQQLAVWLQTGGNAALVANPVAPSQPALQVPVAAPPGATAPTAPTTQGAMIVGGVTYLTGGGPPTTTPPPTIAIYDVLPEVAGASGTLGLHCSASAPPTVSARQGSLTKPLQFIMSTGPGTFAYEGPGSSRLVLLAEGSYDLVLSAQTRGNGGVIDRTAPTIVDFRPSAGGVGDDGLYHTPRSEFSIQAQDGNGVYSYIIERLQGPTGPVLQSSGPHVVGSAFGRRGDGPTSVSTTQSMPMPFDGASLQHYRLRVSDVASDANAATLVIAVRLDAGPPQIILPGVQFEYPPLRRTPFTVSYAYQDDVDLDRVELRRDGVVVQTRLAPPGQTRLPAFVGPSQETFVEPPSGPVPYGPHVYVIQAFDEAGNGSATASQTYTFDDRGPTGTVGWSPFTIVTRIPPQLTITAQDELAGLDHFIVERAAFNQPFAAVSQPISFGNTTPNAPVTVFFTDAVLPDGRYRYRARMFDTLGNESVIDAPLELVVDTQGPLVQITPVDATIRGPGPITFLVVMDDLLGADMDTFRFTIDDARLREVPGLTTVTQSGELVRTTATVLVERLTHGTHPVRVEVGDVVASTPGHTTTVTQTISQDHLPPTIDTFAPAANAPIFTTSAVTISARFHDDGFGVDLSRLKLTLAGTTPPVPAQDVTALAAVTSGGLDVTLTLPDGTHRLTLDVFDQAGSKATLARLVNVDTRPATIQVTAAPPATPLFTRLRDGRLEATLADPAPGYGIPVQQVRVLLDGVDVTAQAQVTPATVQFRAWTPLADGPHELELRMQDLAGHLTTTGPIALQVDGTGPSTPGVPVAGARPFEPTTRLRWAPSTDAGVGLAEYVVQRAENGRDWVEVARTTQRDLVVPFPTGERTAFRVVAVDQLGNQSAPAEAKGCEVAALHDLTTPTTTVLQVEVFTTAGPVLDAVVSERGTGAPLVHQGAGLYRSASVTVPAGQPLNLDVLVQGEAFVSGPLLPLLPEVVETDFGRLAVQRRRLRGHVFGIAGSSPSSVASSTTSGAPIGATGGEACAVGPPALSGPALAGPGVSLLGGFWHTIDVEADPVVSVLQTPPVICARYVPIYFEVVADLLPVNVTAEYSLDGGAAWQPITLASGTLASLAGTPLGRRHVVVWDAGVDLARVALADVTLRLSPQGRPERGGTITTTLLRSFRVEQVSPRTGALDLEPAGPLELTFSEPVTTDVANLTASVLLDDVRAGATYAVTFGVAGTVVTVTPQAALPGDAQVRLRVLPGLLSTEPAVFDQDPLVQGPNAFQASFRVGGRDVTGPRLVSSIPAQGAANVPTALPLQLVLDEDLDPAFVGPQTVVLTASTGGPAAATVTLAADGRTIVVQPSPALLPDRCYTVSVSPDVRDVAGNRLGRAVHVTFTTVLTTPSAPAAPVLTAPLAGSTVANWTTPIAGTAPPNHLVRIYVNGYRSDLTLPVSATGTFSGLSFPLPEGQCTLQGVTEGLNVASPLGAAVSFTVSTSQLPTTPLPPAGAPRTSEVLAGDGSDSYELKLVELVGPAGMPFDLFVTTVGAKAGTFQNPRATLNGVSIDVQPGEQVFPGSLAFDAQGKLRVDIRGLDTAGDGVNLQPRMFGGGSAIGGGATVLGANPVATFGTVGGAGSQETERDVPCSLRARLLTGADPASGDPPYIVNIPQSYPLVVTAVDAQGNPTDAVEVNGQPGSTGATVTTGPDGTADVHVSVKDPSAQWLLSAKSTESFFDGSPVHLGDSDLVNFVDRSEVVIATAQQPSAQNPSYGGNSMCTTGDCPPPDGPAKGAPDVGSTRTRKSHPVLLHNGGETFSRTDLAVPGRGLSFAFTRTYKSFVLYHGTLGHRWSHNYDQALIQEPSGAVGWNTGTTRTETFQPGPGGFTSPRGFFNQLTFVGSQGVIRLPDGTRLRFRSFSQASAPGKLDQIVDRHGNTLTFEYRTLSPGFGELAAVIDPYGRSVTFDYDAQGRISSLTDFALRRVTYEYGTHGDLIRVTSPKFTKTTTGVDLLPEQRFPDGRQELYGYTSGFADERLNHLLQFTVAPEEARQVAFAQRSALEDPAVLRALAYCENTYETDPSQYAFARVTRQRLGGSTLLPPWTGQPAPQEAGGTISFSYEPFTPTSPTTSVNVPVSKTTLVDREGNKSEYFHNQGGECVRLREHANRSLRPRGTGYGQDPDYFERTWTFTKDGLAATVTNPSGSVWRWTYGNDDLDGDGLLTAGNDWNGDGDYDDPEDVQPEDDARYVFQPGDGVLDRLPRLGASNRLRATEVPDARGDSRGGLTPRVWTYSYEPIWNLPRTYTNPCGNDPTYTPQNGGPHTAARYTTTSVFDYQQSTDLDATRAALAAELGVGLGELDALLAQAGVQLGLGDQNQSPLDDERRVGDVVRVVAPSVRLTPQQTFLRGVVGGDTLEIVTLLETNAHGQPIRTVDPERNVHTFEYHPAHDPDGDGVAVALAPTATTGGYLWRTRLDTAPDPARNSGTNPAPVGVESQVFYDPVGNPIRSIDPRGVEHELSFNPLNEVVRTRAATRLAGPFLNEPTAALAVLDYEALVLHDHGGRVVETRVENAGERDGTATTVAANPYWARKVAYDIFGQPVLTLAEVEPVADDSSLTITSPGVVLGRVAYNRNQQPLLVTTPEGDQAAFAYDERGLLFQTISGFGSADAGTVTYHYTVNAGLQVVVDSVKHNPTKWTQFPTGDVTRIKYDGFDTKLCATDPELNCGDAVFDPCGRRVRTLRHGPPEESLPRLYEDELLYDELGRVFRSDARVFENGGAFSHVGWTRTIPTVDDAPAALPELEATSLVELDALSRPVRTVDPKGDESLAEFDGASRLLRGQGPTFAAIGGTTSVRNGVTFQYNQVGQPVQSTSIDRSPVTGVAEQTFHTFGAFDALGRLVEATDPIGLTSRLVYDSRSNVIAASDAKSSAVTSTRTNYGGVLVNDHGNVVHAFFDGLSRPVRTDLLLKGGGQGDGQLNLNGIYTNLDLSNPSNADGKITIRNAWDRSSRLASKTDDNGNTTRWTYDSRSRVTYVIGADGTAQRTVYDQDSLPRESIDRNGTVLTRTFDGAGRLLQVEATRLAVNLEGTGQAVEGSVLQAWEYDGLSRPRVCVDQNDAGGPADDVVTSYTWDSLSRQLSERHRFRASTTVRSAVDNQIGRITVASAGIDKTVGRTFDLDSNRTSTVYSMGEGPGRERTISYGLDGLDRVQQIVEGALGVGPRIQATEWLGGRPLVQDAGNAVRTSFGYEDPSAGPSKRRLLQVRHASGLGLGPDVATFDYTWTKADQRETERFSATGFTAETRSYSYDSGGRLVRAAFQLDGALAAHRVDTWLIDGVGNQVKKVEAGQATALNIRQNGTYLPDQMNEVAKLPRFDAMGTWQGEEAHKQDPNGNRIRQGEFKLFWDAFDRLVRVERTSDGAVVGRYRYDASSRRVDRQFRAPGAPGLTQVFHVHDGAQEIEELDAAGAVQADFVWGGLYIDQLVQMRRGGNSYYLHANSVFSVVAATDASGNVAERYSYSSVYGVCQVQDRFGAPQAAEIGNPWRFQGRRFDAETGFYFFRLRYLDPAGGRWVSRDPLGIWGDPGQVGNAYSAFGNDPVNRVDPWGLWGTLLSGGRALGAECEKSIEDSSLTTMYRWGAGLLEGGLEFGKNLARGLVNHVASAPERNRRWKEEARHYGPEAHLMQLQEMGTGLVALFKEAGKQTAQAIYSAETGDARLSGRHTGQALGNTGLLILTFTRGGESPSSGIKTASREITPGRPAATNPLSGMEPPRTFDDLAAAAQKLAAELDAVGEGTPVPIGTTAAKDIAAASEFLGREIGVTQVAPGAPLQAWLGIGAGTKVVYPAAAGQMVFHTHLVYKSMPRDFKIDMLRAGPLREAVMDLGGNVTFYTKAGLIETPLMLQPLDAATNVVGH